MNPNPPWTHLKACFTITIFFLILLARTRRASSVADPRFLACRDDPKSCDDGKTIIKFPFFIKHLGLPFCGRPGYELSCNEKRQTILKLPGNDDYIVHNISYENQTLRVSNTAFSDLGTLCDAPIHNLTLLSEHYQLDPETTNASLLLNCSSTLHGDILRYSIGCSSVNDKKGVVLARPGNDSKWVSEASKQCGGLVVAPVDGGGEGVAETMMKRLGSGFVLKWRESDCSECQGSGGECGFNLGSHHFQCFCPDRPRAKHCSSGNGNSGLKLGLGLGLGLGIGFAFIVGICLFLWRCNKQKHASSEYNMRNTSSDPSTADLEEGTVHNGVHVFLYSELEEATNHFNESNEIGDGGFGAVYYGKLKDGREVAVKRLYEHNCKRLEQFINEIQILARLRYKNLVSLYGCTSRRSRELLLVYEFIPNGTLAYHLHGEGSKAGSSMAWPIRMSIAIETASALAYLHASDIIHRDVKTDNILLDNNYSVKVADFGLSRLFPIDVTHVSTAPQGTPGYVDPEYHQCYQLTDKSDVYSFGVVLIELISSMPAVDITRHRHNINLANLALNRIQEGTFTELVDPNLGFDSDDGTRTMILLVAELAFRCLQQDNEVRPDMEEVLETLRMIQGGGTTDFGRVSGTERSCKDLRAIKTEMPPRSPGCCDKIGLLKNVQVVVPPASPDTVTERWLSSSSSKTNPSM